MAEDRSLKSRVMIAVGQMMYVKYLCGVVYFVGLFSCF